MRASRIRGTIFEGTDYLLDLETTSRRKKRCRRDFRKRDISSSQPCRLDEDYAKLLDDLLGPSDSEMEEDKDEDDSTYMMFLENLKEHGNSYILDVALEHGVLFPIKYEAEEVPLDKLNKRLSQSCSSNSIQNIRSLGVNSDMESGKSNFNSLKKDTLIQKSSRLSGDGDPISGLKSSGLGKEYTQICSPRVVKNFMNAQMKSPVSKLSEEIGYSSGQDCRFRSRAEVTNETYGVFIRGLNKQSVSHKNGDVKQVHYEAGDLQKTKGQNQVPKAAVTPQTLSSEPSLPASIPSQTTPTLKSRDLTHAQTPRSLTAKDRHNIPHELSKRAPTTPLPTRLLTPTPTLRSRNPTHAQIPRSLTVKDQHTISHELSETAPTTPIPTKPLTPNPTPRAPTSTSTFTPRTSIGCSSGWNHRSNSRADKMNESYKVFMSGFQANGDSFFYEYGDGKRVYYEGGDHLKSADIQNKSFGPPIQNPTPSQPTQIMREPPPNRAYVPRPLTAEGRCKTQNDQSVTTSTAQIMISRRPSSSQPAPTPRVPTSTCTPTLRTSTSKRSEHQGNPSMRRPSWFHERLESICREPYKKKEYEDLLEQVNLRKPMMVHKDTRGSEYTRPGEMGKSYLDNFPDLDHEIKKVESDPHKVLNLLRGFFFYLQKVPRGVPRPWRDESCRAIMLGKRLGDS